MRSGKMLFGLVALVVVAGGLGVSAWAQDKVNDSKAAAGSPQGTGGSNVTGRSKSIDFEGEVVEGLNKNPMDSLEHTATRDNREKAHLYRKKDHFRLEMKQMVRDMGFKR